MHNNHYTEWSRLNGSAQGFINPIIKRWKSLISSDDIREHRLHEFIAKHSQFFLWGGIGLATAVSKLRFGAEFVADFVSVYDNWSGGIRYKLTEIEVSHAAPFTKEGVASARLSRAIQQLLSWKSWLADHTSEAKRLFPSFFYRSEVRSVFEYEVIIGRRENSKQWLDRRNTLAATLGINIRSFDSLTDRARFTYHCEDFSSIGDEQHHYDLESRNRLACPFVQALSDPDWRELVAEVRSTDHFMYHYGKHLLRLRRENELANRFRKLQLAQVKP